MADTTWVQIAGMDPSNTTDVQGQAAASAAAAAVSAAAAAAAKTAAEAAQAAAETAFDNFDDIYLGAKASEPTLDNDGDPLTAGDIYFNTGNNTTYIYSGSAWVAIADGIASVSADTTPSLGGNLDAATYNITNVTNLQFAGGTGSQGTVSWNADDETLDLIQDGATLQLGQEVQWHCRNNTGVQINNGTVVMATGTIGASSRITIAPMDGTDPANAHLLLGIATEDIANGTDGKITHFGKVRGVDTSSFSEGQILYVSTTVAGGLTATEPTTGLNLPIAFVVSSHASTGTLAVRVTTHDENIALEASDIGVTVQGYDADTAKYDDVTANFTGTLQNGGSNVVVDTDIGSTVQAYDAGLAYLDGLNFTNEATFKAGVNLEIGVDVQAYDANLTSFLTALDLPTSDGTAGQVLQTNGAGTIAFADAAGGGGSVEITAGGTIANGDPVFVAADGDVETHSASYTPTVSAEIQVHAVNTVYFGDPVYDPVNKVWVSANTDVNNEVWIGVYDGSTWTTTEITNSTATSYPRICYMDHLNKFLVIYENGADCRAKVVSIDGTTAIAGPEYTLSTNDASFCTVVYHPTEKCVVALWNDIALTAVTAEVLSVDGDVITSGSQITVDSNATSEQLFGFHHKGSDTIVLFWKDVFDSDGSAIALTVDGAAQTVTAGSESKFSTGVINEIAACYDPVSDAVICAYEDNTTIRVNAFQVSGTTVSFTPAITPATSTDIQFLSCYYDASIGAIVLLLEDNNEQISYLLMVNSEEGLHLLQAEASLDANTYHRFITSGYSVEEGRAMMLYRDNLTPNYLNSKTISIAATNNATADNFVGFSDGAYSATQTATIQLAGSVSTVQSGLTAGREYYVAPNGDLVTYPCNPAIYAGTALSATELLIKGSGHVNPHENNFFTGRQTFKEVEANEIRVDRAIGSNVSAGDLRLYGAVTEETNAISGTTPKLNPVAGTVQTWTLTANSTPTDGFNDGQSMTLMIDDGTAYTITWPTMTWVNNGGAAPTLATTGYTVVALWKVGSTLYGALVGDGT